MDERQEWLDSLQAGHEVAIGDSIWKVYKISGRKHRKIHVDGYHPFDERGINSNPWSTAIIEPVTKDLHDRIRRRFLVQKLSNKDWKNVSIDTMEKLLEILKNGDS